MAAPFMIPDLPNTKVQKERSPKLYGMCLFLNKLRKKKHTQNNMGRKCPFMERF
jgi:hypothetical protein